MVINNVITNANIALNNRRMQQINEFGYLGNLITGDNKGTKK